MQEKPALADGRIVDHLQAAYGLSIVQVTFLPLGADFNAAVYRVTADDGRAYFLKLRRNAFDELAVALPKFLHDSGIRQVMAPIATTTGQLWSRLDEFHVLLYPFVEGDNGFAVDLSPDQWVELGAALKRIHTAQLPAALRACLPQESYTPYWGQRLKFFVTQAATQEYTEPAAAQLAALLRERTDELHRLIERTEALGQALQARALPLALCHTDIHGWNLLAGVNGDLYIVDWDAPMLAPKERDLMFLVGGVAGVWQRTNADAWFYQGYGDAKADPGALAYYRYARAVEDIAVTCEQIFLSDEGGEDRAAGVQIAIQTFSPNGAVAHAYRCDANPQCS
jgi:spectinomycin phosphotransferase